jgi:hypothetical protein
MAMARPLRRLAVVALSLALVIGLFAPAGSAVLAKKDKTYNPVINPADFVSVIDNQYFPLTPGTTFYYEAETPDGLETDEVYVTHNTPLVDGVTCIEVLDTVKLEGVLTELTRDWYAQDKWDNVWYFGEDSTQYENGIPVGNEGSWTAGVAGALPGIIMEGDPQPGDRYRQEYAAGVAEDMGKVMRLNAKASVPYGDFPKCLETKEWSPLEPGAEEQKFYAPGVGNVLVLEHQGKVVRQELVDITVEP